MAQQDALKSLLIQTGLAIAPLRSMKTPAAAVAFFRKLGFEIPAAAFGGTLSALGTQAGDLINAVKQLITATGDAGIATATVNVFGRLVATVKAITDLHVQVKLNGGGGLPGIDDLPRRLTDFLVLDFMDKQRPQFHQTLHLLGL